MQRVLIIDDHEDTSDFYAHSLRDAYETLITRYRDDALTAVFEFSPDIVLIDRRFMRGSNTFVAQMKAIRSDIKLVLISGSDDGEEAAAAMDIFHTMKPISGKGLRLLVANLIKDEQGAVVAS